MPLQLASEKERFKEAAGTRLDIFTSFLIGLIADFEMGEEWRWDRRVRRKRWEKERGKSCTILKLRLGRNIRQSFEFDQSGELHHGEEMTFMERIRKTEKRK